MDINDFKEKFDAFLNFLKTQESNELLEKMKEQLMEILKKIELDAEFEGALDQFLDTVEQYAEEANLDISELDESLNELYHDIKEINELDASRQLQMSPYGEQA